MTQPSAPTATPAAPTIYTTIPISPADVISRSLHNLTAFVSRLRPWPELIASGTFNRPDSFASGLSRLRINLRYFRINYAIVVSVSGALSLTGSPYALILFALVFALWLLIYFFREDPLVFWGYQVSDRLVLVGLVLVSILAIWLSGGFWSLVLGIVIGILICGVHAVLKNADGLFLDEREAASRSLISSASGAGYGAVPVSDRVEFTISD
ncbi:hypothetical protein P3X46_002627 [Hevea brasiliensis]|uniref:PRA1 family protein n=1 Tax=Hevea brasiliensis TaxID=3981 RepID=A0ABQ9N7D3_HEVBR|nr:PRA1 family protein G2 [Hevea brasiliensis]KAJ9187135.1 hypothetical protein P3X46_002627 [Hevea brasiliensis]